MPLRIGMLTSGRQDWGILRSTYLALNQDPHFDLKLFVGGMHLSATYGATAEQLIDEGIVSFARVAWSVEPGVAVEEQCAQALRSVGQALENERPQALILVGDRFETLAAAIAATLAKIPIIHVHGGEETEGAFDNAFRHAITKMSHLHLVSHPIYAKRVIAMGEEPSSVHVVGSPGLDNAFRSDLASQTELETLLDLPLTSPIILVTVHPTTWDTLPEKDAEATVAAMDEVSATYIITLPNSDPGNERVRQILTDAARSPRRVAVAALGERRYWGLLHKINAMLGNSSSGLIEAPLLGIPVVNVGDRQKGRIRSPSVVDVPGRPAAIAEALVQAIGPAARLPPAPMPLGDGHAGERIATFLADWRPPNPPSKHFFGPAQ